MPPAPAAPAYCLPHAADAEEHQRRWRARLDAGRIGHRLAPDRAILVNHARTAAIFIPRDPRVGDSRRDVF